jgi:hypothetical protein
MKSFLKSLLTLALLLTSTISYGTDLLYGINEYLVSKSALESKHLPKDHKFLTSKDKLCFSELAKIPYAKPSNSYNPINKYNNGLYPLYTFSCVKQLSEFMEGIDEKACY